MTADPTWPLPAFASRPGRERITIDATLMSYATPRQLTILQAIDTHGGVRAAARALGMAQSGLSQALAAVRAKAAIQGYSPDHHMTRAVPDTHVAKGVSTYYNKDGAVTGQWVKSSLSDAKLQAVREAALLALAEELPRERPRRFTGVESLEHLATLYTLTDCHVGMLAWGRETGSDWDLKIAEQTLVGCFEQMVSAAPPARTGFVNQLGDFLHFDGFKAVTPMHGHLLDADGRFERVVEVAIRILRRVIGMALSRHERVVVLLAEGNHDMVSSIWLRTLFAALYEGEPRVQVIVSPLPYYVHQHGETLLAFHHGHLSKNAQLPILIAAQFPKEWGSTTKRYCHTGHRHHVEDKEHSGIRVYQHPTLAARDAHSARGGWVAERQVTSITYHSRFGQVQSHTVTPEMLEEEASA